jgi:RimJ/RimL family protein N-acetyltransferase
MNRSVIKIKPSDTETIKAIFKIHDEMPLTWNPEHSVSAEYSAGVLERVKSNFKNNHFWILSESTEVDPGNIDGMLWSTIRDSPSGSQVCSINSFWINPSLRKSGLAPLLSKPCIDWAKENGILTIECATHSTNNRMREILEGNGFNQDMINYSLKL